MQFNIHEFVLTTSQTSWPQTILCGLAGGIITLVGTVAAMFIIDYQNNKRWFKTEKENIKRWNKTLNQNKNFWNKEFYKNFESEFWLKFTKEFLILKRFILPLLKEIIYGNTEEHYVPYFMIEKNKSEVYIKDWQKHFNSLFEIVNGFEDVYPPKYKFDVSSIWIVWALRSVVNEMIEKNNFIFCEDGYINDITRKEIYNSFHSYYWDNIKRNKSDINSILDGFWNNEKTSFDSKKLYAYFEDEIIRMAEKLQEIIKSDI